MRKIFAIILATMMVVSMAVTAHAATPTLKIKVPQISKIQFNIKLDETTENGVDNAITEAVKKIDFSGITIPSIKLY